MSVEVFGASSDERAWVRWGSAVFVVLAAHLAGAWMISRQRAEASAGEAAPAIMVELAPLPVAPASEPVDVPPGPVSEVQPEPVSETPEAPLEAEPLPEPQIDMPPPPDPAEPVFDEPKPISTQPDTELQVPEAPPIPEPEVVLPKPKPPEKPSVTKPPEREVPKRPVQRSRSVEKTEEKKQVRPQKKIATAPPRSQPAPVSAPAAPAPGVAAASSISPANWRGALVAHLNRAKRYPSEARTRREEGTVRLTFSINRSGRVTGYRIVGSSGSAMLDQEALSMIQRASPLPAPPPEVSGSRISLTVPVRFNLN